MPSCSCGSTVRFRSIIHLLSIELFGESIALPDFPTRPEITGWGMSDVDSYAPILSKKFNYINTFYHQDPYFDITAPLKQTQKNSLDFLISTEVFEHIPPPISIAFENAHNILKPNGTFIFTAPFNLEEETQEHFPDMYQYELIKQSDEKYILKNTTRDGRRQIFEELVFHGGAGATLEMRVFSKNGLLRNLQNAGFRDIKFYSQPCLKFGISFPDNWSLPISARA